MAPEGQPSACKIGQDQHQLREMESPLSDLATQSSSLSCLFYCFRMGTLWAIFTRQQAENSTSRMLRKFSTIMQHHSSGGSKRAERLEAKLLTVLHHHPGGRQGGCQFVFVSQSLYFASNKKRSRLFASNANK